MKKLLFTVLLFLTIVANAQEISKNAIGLRFGSNDGFGYEISYQLKLKKSNRVEIDLGLRNNDNFNFIKGVGLYQWVMPLDGDFNWFAGVGGGFGSWNYNDRFKKNNPIYSNGGTFLLVAGDIGVEYNFDFPLLVAVDFRPEFVLGDGFGRNFGPDIALSLRYTFN